ncbi:MAG TPA: hypothetical protein DCZ95_10790 [Verrucomicrobia bacterium]|nr:MAG: hypothetical protein A2X46_18355 [Lentisphaerae bacterium GWF2_57_35]HBA84570.1 hypothetical protein [Verrucomicrobiota bacterium]
MKIPLLIAIAFLMPIAVPAQMEELRPPPPPRAMPKEAHLEKWLAHIREKNPEEYDQLIKLREADPEAFRAELRERLRYRRHMAHLKETPKLYEFLMSLPPEERNRILDRLAPPPHDRSERFGDRKGPNPEMGAMEDEIRTMVKTYRKTEKPGEKQQIQADIRNRLERLFDLRGQQRLQMIAEAEQDLQVLKKQLDERQANREKIIERRLGELLHEDDLAW